MQIEIEVHTRAGRAATFALPDLATAEHETAGLRLRVAAGPDPAITAIPPAGDRLARVAYRVSLPLVNFREVIVPDCGRTYQARRSLVDFWAGRWGTRVADVKLPCFVFTGQDGWAAFAFGVAGAAGEYDFRVREPLKERALQAWMRRLTLEIVHGTVDFPLPGSALAADGSLTDLLHLRGRDELRGRTWIHAVRAFAAVLQDHAGLPPRTAGATLEPWWCPWTDWHSDRVDHDLMLANAREAVALGIRNLIIDDGWFGPGLDCGHDVELNLGDWSADPRKFPDLPATVRAIHELGANVVLWCAPHAVSPHAACLDERRPFLIEREPGVPALTHNGYHPLCFRSPEARAVMADICLGLIERYGVRGAKYDLFNNVPDCACANPAHAHDTDSMVEGLRRLLADIDRRTRERAPGFVTELKQNYGTPWLHHHGTCMRAGDTPYDPLGNFARTAYVAAYTPYAINDYQTLSNDDDPADAMVMIVRMLAAGIPTYSMDLVALREEHRRSLRFYHDWYRRHLAAVHRPREPRTPDLGWWTIPAGDRDCHIVIDGETRLALDPARRHEILVGTVADVLHFALERPAALRVVRTNPQRDGAEEERYQAADRHAVAVAVGDLVEVEAG